MTNLVTLAARTRDPLRLAVALRAHDPESGARASFTALGLRDLLDHLGWPLDASLVTRFERFAMDLAPLHPEPLWQLRREQVRRLRGVIEQPRDVVLRPQAGSSTDAELVTLLVESANRGLLLADVRALAGAESELPRAGVVRRSDLDDDHHLQALRAWRTTLLGLDVRAYVDVLARRDRDVHPDVLRAATLRDVAALGRASTPTPEQRLEASLAALADDDGDADLVVPRSGALQA